MKQDYIKKLIRILENSQIDSIQLSSFWGMNKIKLFKSSQKVAFAEQTIPRESIKTDVFESNKEEKKDNIASPSIEPSSHEEPLESSSLHDIKAPLVGTFYLSPKPGEPPFIKVGDKIKTGQILCIIEAMKIFNEIESEVSGTIKDILIDDSNPVEYGQSIILVETDD